MLYLPFPDWLQRDIIPGLIHWYSVMYIVAAAITYLMFMVQVRQRRLDVDHDTVLNFFFWAFVGLLFGARLFATLLFEPTHFYLQRPWLIFWPFRDGRFVGLQGMNYYGGLVGAVGTALVYARAKKIDVLEWGDMLLAGLPLGYAFGRIGNFINAELYGRLTKAPWGIVFASATPFRTDQQWVREWAADVGVGVEPGQTLVNLPRHPTQLYEALAEGAILWLILWFVVRRRKPFPGFVIGAYVVLYGLFRFVIDYFRMPISATDFAVRLSRLDTPIYLLETPLNLIPSQFYSMLMVIGGVVFLLLANRKNKRATQNQEQKPAPRQGRALRKKIRNT